MKVTIAVVCLNEAHNLKQCLDSIFGISYSKEDYEVLIVDGGSKDNTEKLVTEYKKNYSNLRMIIEPRKGTALARKVAIENAKYDYVAFTDADCEVPNDWISVLTLGFEEYSENYKNLVAVGGGNTSPNDANTFLEALTVALNTFLGSMGSVQGRKFNDDRTVESLATLNVLYDKEKILEVGNFDERFLSDGEDADMNFRLRQAGFVLVYLSNSNVFHKYRQTAESWAKNMKKYGRARAKLLKKHGLLMWNIYYLIPMLFLISMFLVPFAFLFKIFYIPLLYFPIIAIYSLSLALREKRLDYFTSITKVFIVIHIFYPFGMLKEFIWERQWNS